MVSSIQAGQGPEGLPPPESHQERQKMFELEWNINLIGTYVAVSNKGGDADHTLQGIKKELAGGKSPEKLMPAMNQLIDQLNKGLPPDSTPLPPFSFTSTGNENQAMTQYAVTLEKFLNTAANQGKLDWNNETELFDRTTSLINDIGTIPLEEAKSRLNTIVDTANSILPPSYQLPRMRI